MTFFEGLLNGILATSLWEWLAVLSSILYVIFAARKSILCWLFAVITSLLYVYICFISQLYIETSLQVFYFIMALFGWWSWNRMESKSQHITQWRISYHIVNIVASGIIAFVLGYLFDVYTDQANPYVDAFTTVYSLAATFMVTKQVLENWLYWIVIDIVSIYLYAGRELYLTAVLFFVFTVLAVLGYFAWKKKIKEVIA